MRRRKVSGNFIENEYTAHERLVSDFGQQPKRRKSLGDLLGGSITLVSITNKLSSRRRSIHGKMNMEVGSSGKEICAEPKSTSLQASAHIDGRQNILPSASRSCGRTPIAKRNICEPAPQLRLLDGSADDLDSFAVRLERLVDSKTYPDMKIIVD